MNTEQLCHLPSFLATGCFLSYGVYSTVCNYKSNVTVAIFIYCRTESMLVLS